MTKAVSKTNTIRGFLQGPDFRERVAETLPRHLTPERFIRVAVAALNRTPKLQQCTQESFFSCLIDLSALGLEPDGRNAHLIPYGDTCTLIIDYKGLVTLAMRSGLISNIHADLVCENDSFKVDLGEIKEHRVDYRADRGKPYAAYAIARFKDGSIKSEIMTVKEIEAVRARSRAGKSGPWVSDWGEMAKKTVFRRLSKWLQLSPELTAIDQDYDTTDEVRVARPVSSSLDQLADDAFKAPDEDDEDARIIEADAEVPPAVDAETGELI